MKLLKIFLIFMLAGCSFIPRPVTRTHNVVGQIIRPEALVNGGVVEVVPFSAGIDAAAGVGLDKAALLIARGIENGLESDDGLFQIVYGEQIDQQVDLFIAGRIEQMETRDNWKRYFGGSRKRTISLKGKAIDRNGNIVATFDYELQKRYQDISHVDFLLMVGQEIGEFLTSKQ